MEFPPYIQKAVDLGLLIVEDGKIIDCKKDEVETIMGMSRLVEKLQPTSVTDEIDTEDQESIVLCRVLNSNTQEAHELWGELRIAFGIGHGQAIPDDLWTNGVLRAIGKEIDRTFTGDRNSSVISKENLIHSYSELGQSDQPVGITDFSKAISELSSKNQMASYGDASSEWKVALDLLRQQRVRSIYTQTRAAASKAEKAKAKLSKQIEFEQTQLMMCLGMLNGTVGNQGNYHDAVEELFSEDKDASIINRIMLSRGGIYPISTGIEALDLDIQGGVRQHGQEAGGRTFTLGARTGVGKSILGVQVAVGLAMRGVVTGFISAEMSNNEISARIWSAATRHLDNKRWVTVTDIEDPGDNEKRTRDTKCIVDAAKKIRAGGGKLLIEAPWGATADTVVSTLRSMKSKNPKLRFVVLDHFHYLGRHQGAPHTESAMLEERAYMLSTAAKELRIDLLCLAQLNRIGMNQDVKANPDDTWIRGTDALAHVSHAVWIVRREQVEKEAEAWFEAGGNKLEQRLELWHAKNRGAQVLFIDDRSYRCRQHIEKSLLTMDYAHSSVQGCDTKGLVKQAKRDG
jgi:replicative DNA helicase